MKQRLLTSPILLFLGLLTSGGGCHVLHIPSHRMGTTNPAQYHCGEENDAVSIAGNLPAELSDGCPPTFLPPRPAWLLTGWPVPGWWVKWQAEQDLPEPAPYPRFHPLPTRPMFSPRPDSATPLFSLSESAGAMPVPASVHP